MYAVILAGGSGTRFWPLSRKHRPKQLLSLFGDRPMVAETVHRFEGLVPLEQTLVVTSEGLASSITDALPELPAANVLAEPVGRNTAPCIGLAALALLDRTGDPSTVMGVFPADHFIRDRRRFQDAVRRAVAAAESGAIVALGIEPTRPETGYGYIRHEALDDDGTARVESFVEKPTREVAMRYLHDGSYLWNAGIFVFRIDTILAEFARQMPKLRAQLDEAAAALRDGDEARLAEVYGAIEGESIDYGIMEGAEHLRVVAAPFGWSDVGAWDALPDVTETDTRGNVAIGDVISRDCNECVLMGHDRRVLAAVGLERIVVVDTEDALLVAHKDRVQEVRAIVEALRGRANGPT